jgi:aspartate 1-decarboxylase
MELRWVLAAKLHGISVTSTDLYYTGSISLPAEMIRDAGLRPNDAVEVYNFNSGARYRTYVIEGDPGQVQANGPSARLSQPGDRLVLVQYVLTDGEIEPRIAHYNEENVRVPAQEAFRKR